MQVLNGFYSVNRSLKHRCFQLGLQELDRFYVAMFPVSTEVHIILLKSVNAFGRT